MIFVKIMYVKCEKCPQKVLRSFSIKSKDSKNFFEKRYGPFREKVENLKNFLKKRYDLI